MAAVPVPVSAADTLKVIVIDGDEAANIVAERLAAVPVVEVRDKDDRRVPGAVVRFLIRKARNRLVATFRNGQAEVRTITDAAGQANSSAIVPLEPGSFEIEVEVSYAGDSGKAVVRQTNFRTVAEAKAAGREPGKSTSSNNALTSTTGSTTGAPAAGTSAATTTATTGATAAAAAAGGMSKVAVIGLAVGGAAGAGAAVALSRKSAEPPPAGVVGSVTPSQTSGVQAATPFTFSVQATGFDSASTRYRWDFGDGGTSIEAAPIHVFEAAGTFTVSVTVSDARQSLSAAAPVTVYSVNGTWRDPAISTGGGATLQLTQTGSTVTGVGSWDAGPNNPPYAPCPLSGSIERGTPAVVLINQPSCRHPNGAMLVPIDYRLNLSANGQVLSGRRETPNVGGGPATFTRQ